MASKVQETKLYVHTRGDWMTYTDAGNNEKKLLKCVVVDEKMGAMYLWSYDYDRHNQYLHVGYTLKVKNLMKKKEGALATRFTRILRTADMQVTAEQIAEATTLASRTPVALENVKLGMVVNVIKGRIESVEAPREVNTKNGETKVRDMLIGSGSTTLLVSMWREAANMELVAGQVVQVQPHAPVAFNTFKKTLSISVASVEQVEIVEDDLTEAVTVTLDGVGTGEEEIELCCQENDKVYIMDYNLFMEFAGTEPVDSAIDSVIEELPVKVAMTVCNSRIMNISRM